MIDYDSECQFSLFMATWIVTVDTSDTKSRTHMEEQRAVDKDTPIHYHGQCINMLGDQISHLTYMGQQNSPSN